MKAIMRDKSELKGSGIEWIGDIPYDWNISRIGNFFCFRSGDTLTNEQIKDEEKYPVYGANGCRGYYDQYNLNGKYILLGRVGALCGNVHIVNESVWVTEHALIAEMKKEITHEVYAYIFDSMNLIQYSKASAQPVISSSTLMGLRIPIIPLEEQQVIRDYLDDRCAKIDAIIAEAKASIEEYKELKQAVIDDSFPVEQRKGRLKHFGDVKTGPFGTQLSANEYVAEGVPCINVKNISYGTLKSEDLDYLPEGVAERLSEHRLELDDIVFARKGSIDKHAIIKPEQVGWVQGSDCIRLRLREDVLQAEYVNLYIGSTLVNEYLAAYSNGATMASLNSFTIGNIPIVIPDVKTQNEIVLSLHKKLADINALISEKQSLIADLEAYKKSLIYEVVTGKRKVVA